ncbi:MAG TPA: thiamine phosphate synthase [Pyrinomonadaceae bacterium]|jgi:thiamine-phosphate pyrophosphorylase|nr:thiamine phosphate synthase [Pyrinomonadaceae bacterium]
MNLPKLYPITDARLTGLSHAEQVARLRDGGACFIQLREKHLSPREFHDAADEAITVARERGVRLIVNDRADIALAIGADGVHLGQDDLDPAAARRLLGERFIIGYSTHTVAQAIQAARLPLDYIALGPIFSTRTKENPDPTVGLEALRRVRDTIDPSVALVAIGGITRDTAPAALAAGADSVALVSALLDAPDLIAKRTKELRLSLS